MKKILYTLILALSTHVTYAQSISNTLGSYMTEVREGSYKPIPKEILDAGNEKKLFANLQPYTSDTLDIVRSKALYIFKLVGQKSKNDEIRQKAIDKLVAALNDDDSGISGNASEALAGFKKADFTSIHKSAIGGFIKLETPHLDQVLKLAGYIHLIDQKAQIHQIIQSQAPFKYKWAGYLALARMGDQKAIDYIINKLKAAPINDNLVYDIVPDLVYTRQQEIFRLLENIVQSNEKNCMSADPDASQNILCGYRVMEYLAPVIDNYPLPTDEFGELEVDDYEAALQQVREWFAQHERYAIKADTF